MHVRLSVWISGLLLTPLAACGGTTDDRVDQRASGTINVSALDGGRGVRPIPGTKVNIGTFGSTILCVPRGLHHEVVITGLSFHGPDAPQPNDVDAVLREVDRRKGDGGQAPFIGALRGSWRDAKKEYSGSYVAAEGARVDRPCGDERGFTELLVTVRSRNGAAADGFGIRYRVGSTPKLAHVPTELRVCGPALPKSELC